MPPLLNRRWLQRTAIVIALTAYAFALPVLKVTPVPAPAQPSAAAYLRLVNGHPLAFTDPGTLDTEFAQMQGDGAISVQLPSGAILWAFGDTMNVPGRTSPICSSQPGGCKFGYPHDTFAEQPYPGSTTLTPMYGGQFGYNGLQYLPNGSDGSWLWPGALAVQNGTLYVYATRAASNGQGGAFGFNVTGEAVAELNATTLAYERTVDLPANGIGWSSIAHAGTGWWLAGSDGSSTKEADIAWVPNGDLATPSRWVLHRGVIKGPIGSAVALARIGNTDWQIATKRGDILGNVIDRYIAATPKGPWTLMQGESIPAPVPAGCYSYGVALHPEEQQSPYIGPMLSYSVAGTDACYHPLFVELP